MRRRSISLREGIAEHVLADAAGFAPLETGGVLLGFHDDESGMRIVTELVGAGPKASRQRHLFTPDGPWQRAQIAEIYNASGRILAYLGDWHSHPHGNGPSALDRSTARKIATTPAARCPHPVFLIAARVQGAWGLRAYEFGARRFRKLDSETLTARPGRH